MTVVELRRASFGWGDFDVPPKEREYVMAGDDGSERVGCLSEYSQLFAERGLDRVTYKIRDKDGTTWLCDVPIGGLRRGDRRGDA